MSVLPKAICRFNESSIKIPAGFFCNYQQAYYKVCMESRGLGKKNTKQFWKWKEVGGFILPDVKTYYKSTIIKAMCY